MQRNDDPSNATTRPAPLATVAPGYFKRPSVVAGDQGTIVTADLLNDLVETVIHPILAASIALVKGDDGQLTAAINALASALITTHNSAANETTSGHARFATAAEVLAGTLATAFLSPLRLKEAFPASFANPGFIQVPTTAGKGILNWGKVTLNAAAISITLPRAYSTAHMVAIAGADVTPFTRADSMAAAARPDPATPLTKIEVRNTVRIAFDVWWISLGY